MSQHIWHHQVLWVVPWKGGQERTQLPKHLAVLYLVTETFAFSQIFFFFFKAANDMHTHLKRRGSFESPGTQRARDEKHQPGSNLKHASLLMSEMRGRIKTWVFLTDSSNT